MRIISKFRDYYDCIQRQDLDRTVLYLRKEEIEYHNNWDFPIIKCYDTWVDCSVIGFCGKIYPLVEIAGVNCFNINDAEKHIRKYYRKKEFIGWSSRKYDRHWGVRANCQDYERHFKWFSDNINTFKEVFLEKRCPIFLWEANDRWDTAQITWNPCLKSLNFQKIIPINQAYQEISMFMNNLGNPEKPIPKIDDVTMAEAKGFNKFSFRKDKSK